MQPSIMHMLSIHKPVIVADALSKIGVFLHQAWSHSTVWQHACNNPLKLLQYEVDFISPEL